MEFRACHHAHGTGDFLRVADRRDATFYFFERCQINLLFYDLQFDGCCRLFDDGSDVVVYLTLSKGCEHIVLMGGAKQVKEGCLEVTWQRGGQPRPAD